MKHYIIDGNNLIGKIKKLSLLQNKDKQSAREQLVYLLNNLFADRKIKISLHFDGFENNKLTLSKGKIIYSQNLSADDKIKEQISSDKSRKNLVVVSSDINIRDYAKVCGCNLISSEDFCKEHASKGESDEEQKRISEINNIDEFKKLFNAKD